ncbi:hypothetical protein D3C73_278280 [compost metagenome]
MKVEDILKIPITEIHIQDIEKLVEDLIKARTILKDAVNCSAVCNSKDYDMIRERAFRYFVPKG